MLIQLRIIPEEAGEIKIIKIEWDLFERFKCQFEFKNEPKF